MSTVVSGTRPLARTPEVSPISGVLTNPRICRIGDSITSGRVQESHYTWATRVIALLATAGISVTWVGTQNSGDPSDSANEGYGGTGIVATNSRVAQFTTLDIQIAIVMLGMNDANGGVDLDINYYMQYFLNAHALKPTCRFLWMGPSRSTETARQACLVTASARMAGAAARLRSYGVPMIYIDQINTLASDGSQNADGLHPTVAGHTAMGDVAYPALLHTMGIAA